MVSTRSRTLCQAQIKQENRSTSPPPKPFVTKAEPESPPPLCHSGDPSFSKTLSPYEALRLARIAENQAQLEALGVKEQAGLLSHFKVKKAYVKRALDYSNIRRSDRLKNCKPPEPKPGLYDVLVKRNYSRRIGSLYTRKQRFDQQNGEIRPANAPVPAGYPNLALSPALKSQRCNSKGRGSIYDSIVGICCHFCRQKKLCGEEDCERCGYSDVTKPCLGKTDCSKCHSPTGVFCRACLRVRYGEDIEEVRRNSKWICPHCSALEGKDPYWICNSSICLARQKLAPTGIAIFEARAKGYKSVAHYLKDELKKRGFRPSK